MEKEIQKGEIEDTGSQNQISNAPIYCVNNCGFFGSVATNNFCSKCYKDQFLKQSKASSVTIVAEKKSGDAVTEITVLEAVSPLKEDGTTSEDPTKRSANRCSFCKKRVGLTGFKCRCDQTFCSVHRYSDKHNCLFDYKTSGQEAIAKENPVVKAEKIEKI